MLNRMISLRARVAFLNKLLNIVQTQRDIDWHTSPRQVHFGEFELGMRAIETGIRISSNDVVLHVWLSLLSTGHYLTHDYEKAAQVANLAVQRGPNYPPGWRNLANALGQLGRRHEAREALAQFLALMPGFTTEQAARASMGFRDEAVFQHYLEGLRKAGWTG